MKELKEYFVGRGEVKEFIFNQIEKSEFGYIYEVNTGTKKYYEVFKRKENDLYNCISYPNSKSFGIWAWTFGNLEKAKIKFNDLEVLFESKIGL